MNNKFVRQIHGNDTRAGTSPTPTLYETSHTFRNRVGAGLAPALARCRLARTLASLPRILLLARWRLVPTPVSLRWIKDNSVMLVNAGSLIGTTAVTSLLGFVYWWLAARHFPPDAVGIASASVSAMVLLGGFCVLGLGTLLITELPRQPDHAGSLISTALVVVGTVGGTAGLVFALVAPLISKELKELSLSLANMALFAAGVSLTAMGVVLDQALVGLLRGKLQFGRNALFAFTKLVALVALSLFSARRVGIAIYATWALGIVLSLLALALYFLHEKRWPGSKYLPRPGYLRQLGGAAIQHHMLNMTLQAPVLILPVLVTALLSATMNAWFYVSWMIVNFVFLVPNTLTIVLHAISSAQQALLARKARITLALGLAVSLLANCVLQLSAKQVLALFGASYAQQATWTLRVLLLAAVPLTIKYHYIAICRVRDRIRQAMLGMLPGGLLELSAATLGARLGGLTGLSAGWVAAITIEALFMLRVVVSAVRLNGDAAAWETARAYSVGTGGGWEDGRGPCACPRPAATCMLHKTWMNRVGTGTGTRPPDPLNHSPCPYRTKEQLLPDLIDKIHQTNDQPDYVGGDAIWLMDTISMPIVRLTAIKHANKEIERRWGEYSFQPPWRINRCEHEELLYPVPGTITDRQHADSNDGY